MPRFRITVEALGTPTGTAEIQPPLTFEAENHDDILRIARHFEGKLGLESEEAHAFAIGLKLFGETLLRHRARTPFSELRPAFSEFMKAIKAEVKS